jgi:hypothetical protein
MYNDDDFWDHSEDDGAEVSLGAVEGGGNREGDKGTLQ